MEVLRKEVNSEKSVDHGHEGSVFVYRIVKGGVENSDLGGDWLAEDLE